MITPERKKALLLKINKLDAYTEIQNTMGRMIAAVNFRQKDEVLKYFALEMEDVSLEYADEGVFEGKEAVEAGIEYLLGKEIKPGEMIDLQLTTPIIEVADDCMVVTGSCFGIAGRGGSSGFMGMGRLCG